MPPLYFEFATAPLVLIYYDEVFELPDYSFMFTFIDTNNFVSNLHIQNLLISEA